MDIISSQVDDIHEVLSPTPITVQMTGLRVKLPYDRFALLLKEIIIEEGITIGEVAEILPSRMRDYILQWIKPFSETNIMV